MFLCIAVLIGFVTLRVLGGFSEQSRALYATVLVSVLGVGNAFTMGALSGPFDRYQSRVIWLLPLLASRVVLERFPYPGHGIGDAHRSGREFNRH